MNSNSKKRYITPFCNIIELVLQGDMMQTMEVSAYVENQGGETGFGNLTSDEYHSTSIWEDENDFDGTFGSF